MVIGGPAGRRRRDSSAHEPPTGEMTVKLTDFGIARATAQTRLTQVGSVVGTAAYLAPEQARGEEATPAADVYALGVVLYQLLTGRLPWEGSTLAELAIRRENERPLPPTSYDPDVPETLSQAVLRSLEGEAAARYSSARDLSRALEAGLRGRGAAAALRRAADRHARGRAGHRGDPADGSPDPRTPGRARAGRPAPPPCPAAPRPAVGAGAGGRPSARPAAGSLRALGILLLIAILAALIAGAVLAAHRRRSGHRPRPDDQGQHQRPDPGDRGLHQGEHPVGAGA